LTLNLANNESGLKKALREWEADPVGKCGTCLFADGFDNDWEIDKTVLDTCVRCTSRDKAVLVDAHAWEGRKRYELIDKQGWFRMYRIEAQGRFYCPCWKGIAEGTNG